MLFRFAECLAFGLRSALPFAAILARLQLEVRALHSTHSPRGPQKHDKHSYLPGFSAPLDMLSRTRVPRGFRASKSPFLIPSSTPASSLRSMSTYQKQNEVPKVPTAAEKLRTKPGWLTQRVENSPAAKRVFLAVAKALGYGSPKQVAGMQAFAFYERICAVMPDQDRDFWRNGACSVARNMQQLTGHPSRLRTTTYIPVLVHHHQFTRLASHCPASCPPPLPSNVLPTSAPRPLLHRHRGPNSHRSAAATDTYHPIYIRNKLLPEP